jgi:hypothetical protein
VNDGWKACLRIAERGQETRDAIQAQIDELGMKRQ